MCILFIETINFLSQAIYPYILARLATPDVKSFKLCWPLPGPPGLIVSFLVTFVSRVPGPRSVVTTPRVHTMMDVTLPHTNIPPSCLLSWPILTKWYIPKCFGYLLQMRSLFLANNIRKTNRFFALMFITWQDLNNAVLSRIQLPTS